MFVSKEENLDRNGQRGMEHDHKDQEEFGSSSVGGVEHRVEVTQQKGDTNAEADTDEDPVQ